MKKLIPLFCGLLLGVASLPAYAQKYKSAADTARLSKEYENVSREIADLTSRLTTAQNNLTAYESKASSAGSEAQNAAVASSEQATRAISGSTKEARRAKRKAKRAFREAKDARAAGNAVGNQHDKIETLTKQLERKQRRLQELDDMRAAINAKSPQ